MNGYLLKEYGSWTVFIVSFLIGCLVNELKGKTSEMILSFIGLFLLINSKLHITIWMKQKNIKNLKIFLIHIITGFLFIYFSIGNNIANILHFSILPVLYIISIYRLGEHHILTELAGFATLALSAVVSYFTITGQIDYKLYLLTLTFFSSGVFKVRVQLRKSLKYRVIMVTYVTILTVLYYQLKISLLIMIPLLENIVHSIKMYRVKLKLTGWIEVAKSIVFLLLTLQYY